MTQLLFKTQAFIRRSYTSAQMYYAADRRLFHFIGLKRSGNHALINWLKPQMPGRVHHMNNIQPYIHPLLKDRKVFETRETHAGYPQNWMICSYEDRDLNAFRYRANARYILLLRDPFNLFASRMRRKEPGFGGAEAPERRERVLRLWCQYAERFASHDPKFVRVVYDRWKDNPAYRRQLAEQLGLRFTDAGLNTVSRHGGGSSFEGQSKDGRASEMQTTDRWRHFIDDDAYWRLLDNPRLLELAHQVWPEHSIWPVVSDKLGFAAGQSLTNTPD